MKSANDMLLAALGCAFVALAPAASAQMGGGMDATPQREDPNIAYQAGVTALNAGNYSEAIRQLRAARRALPRSGPLNYTLGLAYNANGDKDEAKEAFERAVRARDAPVPAHLQLGHVALDLGDRETATEQQTELQRLLSSCDAECGDARRREMQTSLDRLTQALASSSP